jgi:hypothetical protein
VYHSQPRTPVEREGVVESLGSGAMSGSTRFAVEPRNLRHHETDGECQGVTARVRGP